MAKRSTNEPQYAKLAAQQMRDAIPKLQRRIEDLKRLEPDKLTKRGDPRFEAVETKANNTLAEIFGHGTVQYNNNRVSLDTASISFMSETPHAEIVEGYKEGIASAIANFEATVEYFEEELAEQKGLEPASAAKSVARSGNKVFIVHGHDDAARLDASRFVEKLGLEAIVLHEQANAGQTVIEKFEKHAGEARFAIVLLTPDDIGHAVGKPQEAKPRARQNVILEFGFFVSQLGREHVVALLKGNVEMPSDLNGLLYEVMDPRGAWKARVALEMRNAGFQLDLNKL